MVAYLSSFIPGLSTVTAPLHEMLKKDTDFTWNCTNNAGFQHFKDVVINDMTLWYFDPSLPVTIQVDASQVGLGAVLLQNNKPVTFASKALTKAKCHYANIKREMLAVVFGVERFRTCVYGRSFTTDQTTSPWNASPKRTWQTCQPGCSTCYCTSRAMTTSSVTTPVRKWPCLTPSLTSVHILAPTFHWTLPFTMLTCPQSRRKHFNKPL